MTFREYLDMRIAGKNCTATEKLVELRRLPDMPKFLLSWPDLRAWLRSIDAHRWELVAAEAAWRGYVRHLRMERLPIPDQNTSKPLWAVPGGSVAVTDAPVLDCLHELRHEWRMVARQKTAKDWDWAGDLTDETEKRRYLLMRDVHATLTQVSFYPDGECFPVLFARIAPSVNPVDAHRRAAAQVETSSRHAMRWAINGKSTAMAGGIR
jgi:hypothetical protein